MQRIPSDFRDAGRNERCPAAARRLPIRGRSVRCGTAVRPPVCATLRSGRGRPKRECSKVRAASRPATPEEEWSGAVSSSKPRHRSAEGGPELEGARHRAAPIAARAVRRQQVVVSLLFASERKRERPHLCLFQRLDALGQFPPHHVARGVRIRPDEMRQPAMQADLLEGAGQAQSLDKGRAIPQRRGRLGAGGDSARPCRPAVRPCGGRATPSVPRSAMPPTRNHVALTSARVRQSSTLCWASSALGYCSRNWASSN